MKTNKPNRFAPSYDNPRRPIPPSNLPSLTKQEFGDESNINNIVNRSIKTGQPPMTSFTSPLSRMGGRKPIYGDISSVDYHQMMNKVADMQTKFNMLPARTRSKFRNSPEAMMRWLEDEKNYDEAVKLGLLVPDPAYEEARLEAANASKPQKDPNQTDLVEESQKADDEAQPGYERKPLKSNKNAK